MRLPAVFLLHVFILLPIARTTTSVTRPPILIEYVWGRPDVIHDHTIELRGSWYQLCIFPLVLSAWFTSIIILVFRSMRFDAPLLFVVLLRELVLLSGPFFRAVGSSIEVGPFSNVDSNDAQR